jgi:hypothetical protein
MQAFRAECPLGKSLRDSRLTESTKLIVDCARLDLRSSCDVPQELPLDHVRFPAGGSPSQTLVARSGRTARCAAE